MANQKGNSAGPFATTFAWIGGITGAIGGYDAGEFPGMLVTAFVLGGIGYWVGQIADAALKWLIFLATCIVVLFVNAAVRRFAWELLASVLNGS